jgi:cytochrome c-type biogenesis protein CcmH
MAYGLSVKDVSQEFICNCGCGKLLSECDMECGKMLRKIIAGKIGEGWAKDQIVQYMMATYGETLLAAPTKKGFNLTAWTTPFVAIFVAGFLIASILRRWSKKRGDGESDSRQKGEAAAVSDEKYLEKFEKEMSEIEI